jgi:hypothetical protein
MDMVAGIGARLEIPARNPHDIIVDKHGGDSGRAGTILAHRIS